MGILDKVMFWKKKDDFGNMDLGGKENLAFGDDFGQGNFPGQNAAPGTGLGGDVGGRGFGSYGQQYPQPQGFQQQSYPQQPSFSQPAYPSYNNPQQEVESKNLEIISSKLDALRASIESLSQRLANLEAIARGDEEQSRRRRYY